MSIVVPLAVACFLYEEGSHTGAHTSGLGRLSLSTACSKVAADMSCSGRTPAYSIKLTAPGGCHLAYRTLLRMSRAQHCHQGQAYKLLQRSQADQNIQISTNPDSPYPVDSLPSSATAASVVLAPPAAPRKSAAAVSEATLNVVPQELKAKGVHVDNSESIFLPLAVFRFLSLTVYGLAAFVALAPYHTNLTAISTRIPHQAAHQYFARHVGSYHLPLAASCLFLILLLEDAGKLGRNGLLRQTLGAAVALGSAASLLTLPTSILTVPAAAGTRTWLPALVVGYFIFSTLGPQGAGGEIASEVNHFEVRDGSQSRRKKFAITALAAAVFALPSMMRSAILYPMANGSLCQQILGLMLLAVLFWAISRGIFLTAAPSLASGRAHDDNVGLKGPFPRVPIYLQKLLVLPLAITSCNAAMCTFDLVTQPSGSAFMAVSVLGTLVLTSRPLPAKP